MFVIDDEPFIVEVLKRILRREYDVTGCTNPEEAFARIVGGERFDVIVCDLLMPKLTGMELHAALWRYCRDQADRMVFATGDATSGTEAFLDTARNRPLHKPFNMAEVKEAVQHLARESNRAG